MLEPRRVINDCYILRERLGEDSACELWRATAIYSASHLLVRFLKEGFSSRSEEFHAEAIASIGIDAVGIKELIEIDRHEGRLYLVSELRGERSLREVLATGATVGIERSCRLLIELSRALDAYHQRKKAYRFLTAENVLARISGGLIEQLILQKPGYGVFLELFERGEDRLENLAYLAPELRGGKPGDARSDIFSLGVILFRLIVGKLPYGERLEKAERGSLSLSHVANALTRRAVPEELTRTILAALRRNPRQRQQLLLDFMEELGAFVDRGGGAVASRGAAAPGTGLDRANLEKVGAGAAMRMLDTVAYFKALSEAYVKDLSRLSEQRKDFGGFSDPAAVERLERHEVEGGEEDGGQHLDYVIELARETVAREPWGGTGGEASRPQAPTAVSLTPSAPELDWEALRSPFPGRSSTATPPLPPRNPPAARPDAADSGLWGKVTIGPEPGQPPAPPLPPVRQPAHASAASPAPVSTDSELGKLLLPRPVEAEEFGELEELEEAEELEELEGLEEAEQAEELSAAELVTDEESIPAGVLPEALSSLISEDEDYEISLDLASPFDDPELMTRLSSALSGAVPQDEAVEPEKAERSPVAGQGRKATRSPARPAPRRSHRESLKAPAPGGASQAVAQHGAPGEVAWKEASAAVEDVIVGMSADFRRAMRGKGAFRFIQEPEPGLSAVVLSRALQTFADEALYLDIGHIEAGADAEDLLRAIRIALLHALRSGHEPESKAGIGRFRRRVLLAGGERLMGGPPLGSLLFGADRPEPGEAAIAAASATVAAAVAAFGRRRKPVVLVIRGCEMAGRSAHALLLDLARVGEKPLCVFGFFKRATVPGWHVLSRLEGASPQSD
jgi:hypothetical protein